MFHNTAKKEDLPRAYASGILPCLGGLCALVTVMGIGRFAYTALLPGMMEQYAMGEALAGAMAAWNYAGYLAGVLLARGEGPGRRRYVLFALFLLLSLCSTAGMGLVHTIPLWHGMRFLGGLASGVCFVLCSSIVFDTLAMANRPGLAGLIYSGVGCGIALGGIAAGPLVRLGGQAGAWLGMAGICLPLALAALVFLRPQVNMAPPVVAKAGQGAKDQSANPSRTKKGYRLLLFIYFLEGFGYIIGTTFLVALIKDASNSPQLAATSWIVTGCAAAVSAPLWRLAARRGGYLPMLCLSFALQGVGVLLPALFNSVPAALAGGLLLGGTFMGITVLSLQYGVALSGKASAYTVAVMTAVYGVGQIIGPFVAGLAGQGNGFAPAFIISACALFLGAALLLLALVGKKKAP
ncbi:YbfB/YjiJ family MFS transporter [Desulfovibrio sp. OttesenSCG-928-A18]|nr:YbfB/YjiJ family MFS transporter [Desulfovibrio sp. OttesenSCG-928-A18]